MLKKINLESEINNKLIENDKLLKMFLISKNISEKYINEKNLDYYKNVFKTIINRGDSRPDGWIFVFKKENITPDIIIALESKLWDLDPYQIKNHLEKSLGIKENGIEKTKNIKFETLCEKIKNSIHKNSNGIEEHFLNYMEMLGYYIKTSSFKQSDISFALNNQDSSILKNKWEKIFKNYFVSEKLKDLENNIGEKINIDLKNYRIWFEGMPNGNIYFSYTLNETDLKNETGMFIGTEIGVNSKDFILNLQSKIKENNTFIEKISEIYQIDKNNYSTIFSIFKRLNSNSMSKYFRLKDYNNLEECFEDFIDENVYINQISKEKCIKILERLANNYSTKDINWLIEKVKIWKFGEKNSSNYNLLSYLRFVDYVNYKDLYEVTDKQFNELFTALILKHYKGLKLINNI